jgi:hypothetical protein
MKTHLNYTQFPPGEEPITRTFRLAKGDWIKLLAIRDKLLSSHGIKLSLNATFVHLLHLHGRDANKDETQD